MKALGTFLYKAADTRQDLLTYGGGGAALGAGLGAALGSPGDRASGAGLGALAGGTLGSLYGMDKDSLNSMVSGIFKDKNSGNPITTGLGAGVLGAGGLAAKDYLMHSNSPDSLGEPAGGSHEYMSAMGDVPEANKRKFISEITGHENRLAKEILEGRLSTSPIHDNFLKVLKMTGATEQADKLARRLAAKHILGNDDLLNQIKSGIQGSDDAAVSAFKTQRAADELGLNTQQQELIRAKLPSFAVERAAAASVNDPTNKDLSAKLKALLSQDKINIANTSAPIEELISQIKNRLAKEAPKVGVPDAAGFMKRVKGIKGNPSAWGRYGVAGLGAGTIGMMLAGLENKLRG